MLDVDRQLESARSVAAAESPVTLKCSRESLDGAVDREIDSSADSRAACERLPDTRTSENNR